MTQNAKRYLTVYLFLLLSTPGIGQYATSGTGSLKDKIWWLNWDGFSITAGASRTFTTTDGLTVKVTFTSAEQDIPLPTVMNTWWGAVLHLLYDFSDPTIKPALYSSNTSSGTKLSMNITATRDGVPVKFNFVAADAEASDLGEAVVLHTSGSNWEVIDFYKNSSQTISPLKGCNTNTATIVETYGGAEQTGQNPVISTQSSLSGSLDIDVTFEKGGTRGGVGIAFGIFAPIDRGDLPASYGFAQHQLKYVNQNPCNLTVPYRSLLQNDELFIGQIAGDPDGIQNFDDGDDEDGIVTFPFLTKDGIYTLRLPVKNTTGTDAYLTAWFDYDLNGSFTSNEMVTLPVANNAAEVFIKWTGIPNTLPLNENTAFRFRIASNPDDVQNASGYARNGEVEDYLLETRNLIRPTASFSTPSTVCLNSPFAITNTSVLASTYSWTFCVGDLNNAPSAVNLGNIGNILAQPVFMDFAEYNGNYYGFVINHEKGNLIRLDFGNSLLNIPTAINLGNIGNTIPEQAEGIQVVSNEGNWYALIVGGNSAVTGGTRIVKIEFGPDLATTNPSATNWGTIGGLNNPGDLHLVKDGNDWYAFTFNQDNSITRINFGTSFQNTPAATNLGSFAGINNPTGIFAILEADEWHVFATNRDNSTLARLDFGNSLLNLPVSVNLGNPGNSLHLPRDIYIANFCGNITGFVVNEATNDLVKLNFEEITSSPTSVSLGNYGNFSFPHSISRTFLQGGDVYSFVTNINSNSITRLRFTGCANANFPNSSAETPPPVVYSNPGTYNINLTINKGLPTESSFCKEIVVLPKPTVDFSFEQELCSPSTIHFRNESKNFTGISWNTGNGSIVQGTENPIVTYHDWGNYSIKLKATLENGCADSVTKIIPVNIQKENIIVNRDTVFCKLDAPFNLNALPALRYCWSPSTGLSDPGIANPVVNSTIPSTTYYLNSMRAGRNLVINGDFSAGNTGFTSAYNYTSSNITEGQYYVSNNPAAWNINFGNCRDHTNPTGNGTMLLVNGSSQTDQIVWTQSVAVSPNTNYVFSTWIQTLSNVNPARLQFSINGVVLGTPIAANSATCVWTLFNTIWNAGNNTTAVISIVNKNTIANGNDFALDDISFGELIMARDSVTVAIYPHPEIDFSYDVPFCKSPQFTGLAIHAPAPMASWEWNFGDGESSESAVLTHVYANGGSYNIKLLATDENGCQDSTYKTIQLDTIKAVVNADTMICSNSLFSLSGSGGTKYEWFPAAFLDDPTLPKTAGRVSETTRFYLTVKNGIGCENTDSVLISVKPRPDFIKPPDRTVCMDSTLQLAGGNGPLYEYRWEPAALVDDPTAINPFTVPPATMQYQLTVTEVPCAYDTSFSIRVTVNPNPVATVWKQRDIDCLNPTVYLGAQIGPGTVRYEWSPASGVDDPHSTTPLASADTTTTFVLKSTNAFGCVAYNGVTVEVTNNAKPFFVLPNAFTPNGDGINDYFSIRRWGNVTIHEFAIFNRWGQKVFSTFNPKDQWDGRYQGKFQPGGTYAYTIRATSFCGELVKRGTLQLVR